MTLQKPGALSELAQAEGGASLGEIAAIARHADTWPEKLRDGRRAMKYVSPEVADALAAEIGGEHVYEGSFALGARLREGTAWDEQTTTDAIRAKAELRTLKVDAEFNARALVPDSPEQARLRNLNVRANPDLDEAR